MPYSVLSQLSNGQKSFYRFSLLIKDLFNKHIKTHNNNELVQLANYD